ncbi:MAG: hypothetical protein WC966_02935 [Bradymonadales bacterium]|jgi:hypothetical protein
MTEEKKTTEGTTEEKQETASSEQKSGGAFSNLLNKVSGVADQITDAVKEKAEKGKDYIDDKFKAREILEVERKMGRKLYKLHKRGEITLPEAVAKHLEKLDELWEDVLNGKDPDYSDNVEDDIA